MLANNGRPGDARGFVHRRLIGAVTGGIGGLLSGGNPITGAIGGFARGGGSASPQRNTPFGDAVGGRIFTGFAPSVTCGPGFRKVGGKCVPVTPSRTTPTPGVVAAGQRFLPGGATGFAEFGEAVMGQYGAALEPGIRETSVSVCPRGTVLGTDGLCYNRRDIKNSERMWPRGRRPLLTGGDMRCISIAAAAAKKIEKKTKQLQSMGMLKKHVHRRAPKALPAHHD